MIVDYLTSPFLLLFTLYLLNCVYKDFTVAVARYFFLNNRKRKRSDLWLSDMEYWRKVGQKVQIRIRLLESITDSVEMKVSKL